LSAGPDRRLTRDRRLRKAAEFSRVFARPQRVHSESFTVLARENERSEPRLGLAIAKRRIRRASDRNRLKRLVRESFRHHASELSGLDIVVMAKTGAENKENAAIFHELEGLWQKLRSRCEPS